MIDMVESLESKEIEEDLEPKDKPFSIKDLPDSFEKINEIATILKNYP
jgi:hypothetical protein